MTDFRTWFKKNLSEQAHDIANHGADCGFPHITMTSDTVKLFDEYQDELWEMAVADAEEYGADNVMAFISGFKRVDMADTFPTLKNLIVWYACEKVANEMEAATYSFKR